MNEAHMTPGAGVGRDIETYKLGQRLDDLDKQARRFDIFSKERAQIEDTRTQLWHDFRKRIQSKLGGQSSPTSAPLNEYKDPATRLQAINKTDPDRAIKMIFQWTRTGVISYEEFDELIAQFFSRIYKTHLK